MTEILAVRSTLPDLLQRRRWTVAELLRRMEARGFRFDKKTVYRLARAEPLRTLNLPALHAVSQVLDLPDPGKLIRWRADAPRPTLRRVDTATQTRLEELMGRHAEGALTAAERREFGRLGRLVERLSLDNARLLARQTGRRRAAVARRRLPRPAAAAAKADAAAN